VHVRGAHQDRERDAVGVDHKMALRALFAAIRWVLARFLALPGPAPRRSPARPGPSRCDRPGPALREAPGAACARRPLGTSGAWTMGMRAIVHASYYLTQCFESRSKLSRK
jgi:hypothetical protein